MHACMQIIKQNRRKYINEKLRKGTMLGTSKKDGGKGKHEVVGKGKDTANKIQGSHFTEKGKMQCCERQL